MEGKTYSLTEEELENLISKAALVAANVAADKVDKANQKQQKDQADRRLHNTQLLLRNYRQLKTSCEQAVFERCEEIANHEDLLESLMSMKADDSVVVESIRRSAERTFIILSHMDKMLELYKDFCSKGTEQDKRRYKVVKALYISKIEKKVPELAKLYRVSKVTIYQDKKVAEEQISALLFGINGLKILH